MIDIKTELDKLGLNQTNSIVIGSGILNALGIRESNDIDIIVDEGKFQELSRNPHFRKKFEYNSELLVSDLFEIRKGWTVLKKTWNFEDLLDYTEVIDGVRYNSLEFLLEVKRVWVAEDNPPRQKDISDVEKVEKYLSKQKV